MTAKEVRNIILMRDKKLVREVENIESRIKLNCLIGKNNSVIRKYKDFTSAESISKHYKDLGFSTTVSSLQQPLTNGQTSYEVEIKW